MTVLREYFPTTHSLTHLLRRGCFSFVIIKYWYGQENDDFQRWNQMLGLHEPPARNWSGMDKTYFTYREFLIYLDMYRRAQMMEKTKGNRDRKRKVAVVDAKTSPHTAFQLPQLAIPKFVTQQAVVDQGPRQAPSPVGRSGDGRKL